MSAFLYRLGRSSARHPFRVLAIWVVAAVAVVALKGVADGRLDEASRKASVEEVRTRLAAAHDVAFVSDPFGPQSAALSRDGRTAYVDVAYRIDKFTTTQLDDAAAAAQPTRAAGVQTNFT